MLGIRWCDQFTASGLGGYTFEFADYVAAGLTDSSAMNSTGYTNLMNVVDPFQYFRVDRPAWDETAALRNFNAIPKLVYVKFRQYFLSFDHFELDACGHT